MASLDAALSRLAIALDAVEARLPAALNNGGPQGGIRADGGEADAELASLRAERAQMQDEIDRLRSEVQALDELHEEMSNRLDNALREVRLVLAD